MDLFEQGGDERPAGRNLKARFWLEPVEYFEQAHWDKISRTKPAPAQQHQARAAIHTVYQGDGY